MAGANSNIQLSSLDFDGIKNNLKLFLQGQDAFKDYNFEGAGLSVLLDILAYNTQYNAFYLNMVANEMFMDTSLQRSSVISHAKLLNYTPKSYVAPTAFVDLVVYNTTDSSVTPPKYTNFLSESIDGTNYNFVTVDDTTVNVVDLTATFTDIELKQGIPVSYQFTVDSTTNPNYVFELPDSSIDTSTIKVSVRESVSNTAYEIYTLADQYLELTGKSAVFFLQESLTGNYEISFGDGILGKKLKDGNIITADYIITQGGLSAGANSFVLMDTVTGFETVTVYSNTPASGGTDKESLDSIKFQAPKSYAAQKRAVTKNDYITIIQQNQIGLSFDAVNVWGGEENDNPVYGQVFISLKPKGAYNITETQKLRLIEEVIKPISVMTVTPTIVDPDYTYLKLNVNVYYDPSRTNLTAAQIESGVKSAIFNFADTSLNTFNSTFNAYDLLNAVQSYNNSIITSDFTLQTQKKFYPNLTSATTYSLYFNTSLNKGMFQSGVSSSPSIQYRNPVNLSSIIDGVFIEEVPSSTNGVESISIINPGYGYQQTPAITILGDGTGATAHAIISNGSLKSIVVDNAGIGYTSALATVTPLSGDTTGNLGSVVVNLQGRYGTLRTYYMDNKNIKTVLDSNIGTIDYSNGIITLNAFNPVDVNNDLGQLSITSKPSTTIISSSYNRIITIDPYDPSSVTVNVIAKTK